MVEVSLVIVDVKVVAVEVEIVDVEDVAMKVLVVDVLEDSTVTVKLIDVAAAEQQKK